MFFFYFHEFYLRSLKAEKGLNVYRLRNWKKFVRLRANFCPPTGTFMNFFCAIENLSPQTAGTPNIFELENKKQLMRGIGTHDLTRKSLQYYPRDHENLYEGIHGVF